MTSCTSLKSPDTSEPPAFEKVSFEDLPAWGQDNLEGAHEALLKSCVALVKQPAGRAFKPMGHVGDFHEPCRAAMALENPDTATLKQYFEHWFDAYEVSGAQSGYKDGLFTGYYEASLNGSLRRYGPYQTPLYGLPKDHKTKKGPYPPRASIVRNGINAEVIAWVDDPIDAFFVQIQGSGVVTLDDGRRMRVGYAGKNGHGYFAIGRELIDREELTKENVSLQTIRGWMDQHPDQAGDLMDLNPSYVFFRRLDTEGPIGAQGVVVTATRSLAVDKNHFSYGAPVWLDVNHPKSDASRIRRLMIAQDTGGAIRGSVRGDFFWGYGAFAEDMAGEMKSRGRYWFLLPKGISR